MSKINLIFLDMDGVLNSLQKPPQRYSVSYNTEFNIYTVKDHDTDSVISQSKSVETELKIAENLNHKDRLMKLFGIDQNLVNNLKTILDETNSKIVFSTSWRYYKDHPVAGPDWRKTLSEMLDVSQDIFIGDTPEMSIRTRRRGSEIKEWLMTHNQKCDNGECHDRINNYCVIDDIVSDIAGIIDESKIVHTDEFYGLQKKDADKAIRILTR